MRRVPSAVLITLLVLSGAPALATAQVDFEDLTGPTGAAIPEGYGGADWGNFGLVDKAVYPEVAQGVVSGAKAIVNLLGAPASIFGGGGKKFHLFSFFITSLTKDAFPANNLPFLLGIQGIRDGVVVYGLTIKAWSTPARVDLNYRYVDEVRFTPQAGPDWFLLDDVRAINTPEPLGLVLLGTGLAGVAAAARRRRKEGLEA